MKEINAKDPENMAGYIESLPKDLAIAWQQGLEKPLPEFGDIKKILISGMGGSAIGGDLFASYLSTFAPTPIISRRNYGLPAWAEGPDTLVVCSSHSGNTEETLSSFQAAKARGCSLLAISTGGALQREALASGVTHWYFNHTGQPRTAIGWSFGLLLALATRLGFIHNQQKDIDKAVAVMAQQYKQLEPSVPLVENPAKRLAGQLLGRNIAIFAAGEVGVIARRWLLGNLSLDTAQIEPCALASTLPWGVITDTAQAADEYLSVELLGAIPGTIRLVAAAKINAGVPVYTAPSGKVQGLPSSAGTYYQVGYSVTAASANNDELEVVTCVPRQIPNTGTLPIRPAIWSAAYCASAGSPGPFDKNTPAGSRASTSAAAVPAGTTSTRPSWANWRRMVVLTPKS